MELILFLFCLPLLSCLHMMRRPEERALEARERAQERLYLASWGVMFRSAMPPTLGQRPAVPEHESPTSAI